jgi:hypothetical protein
VVRRRTERILDRLAEFEGDTWEQRRLANGPDAAPRGWVEAAFPQFAQKWQRYAADQLADLRALPEYRQALVRHRCDAERCLARAMIPT